MRILSIVIPAYNEERFIVPLLERIGAVDLSGFDLTAEIIVVDDFSTDATASFAHAVLGVRVIRMDQHGGKGRALRLGLAAATGEFVVIQDADLEYNPADYVPMLRALFDGAGDVIYGSRYLATGRHPDQSFAAYIGGRSLGLLAWLLTGRFLTDTPTGYKLARREDLTAIALETTGFEVDQEITAKLLARGRRIAEVPIGYAPRSRAEGKKIGARDWFTGVRTFFKYRRG